MSNDLYNQITIMGNIGSIYKDKNNKWVRISFFFKEAYKSKNEEKKEDIPQVIDLWVYDKVNIEYINKNKLDKGNMLFVKGELKKNKDTHFIQVESLYSVLFNNKQNTDYTKVPKNKQIDQNENFDNNNDQNDQFKDVNFFGAGG